MRRGSSKSSSRNNNSSSSVTGDQRKEARSLFSVLYNSWCHSPVSALSLCFLAQAYDLASVLISHFAKAEITVSFLMQVDKLVQLLESPIFIHVRLEMLEQGTERHFALNENIIWYFDVATAECSFQDVAKSSPNSILYATLSRFHRPKNCFIQIVRRVYKSLY